MKKDHRPYFMKHLDLAFQKWYVNHYLRPQFEYLGKGFTFMKPWYVEVFGGPISLGEYANVIATNDQRIRLTIWSEKEGEGLIQIGKHCLLCPGVRISAARRIEIGDNCMLAQNCYVTDSDWHSAYDRTSAFRQSAPVVLGNNVWVGDSVIICKGVSIGDNSIIGAGSVIVKDVPSYAVAAGNPARMVKRLDPDEKMITRADWFHDPVELSAEIKRLNKLNLQGNSLIGWFRSILFPRKED